MGSLPVQTRASKLTHQSCSLSVLGHKTATASAGDLDEAVQALKATTNIAELASTQADSGTNKASGLTDDDLKPAFMRRLAADQPPDGVTLPARNSLQTDSPAKERPPDDINPRPIARRLIDPASGARQAAAKAVLQASICPQFSVSTMLSNGRLLITQSHGVQHWQAFEHDLSALYCLVLQDRRPACMHAFVQS